MVILIKLRNKILKIIFASIFIVIFVLFILFNSIFTYSFKNYISDIREKRFEDLKTQLSYLLQDDDLNSISSKVGIFAYTENIEIEILDSDNNPIAKFNKLDNSYKLITKEYKIINNNKYIGLLKISYYDINKVDEITSAFTKNMFLALIFVGILSASIGLVSSYFLSKQITENIENLSLMANDYKKKEYESYYDIDTDIEEIENLALNMAYLGSTLKKQEELRYEYSQNISHELKTPLTNLLLFIEAIDDGVIDLDEESIKSLKDEIIHMNGLVEKLRQGFNDESKISENTIEYFNLSKVLLEISKSLYPSAKANKIKIETKLQNNIYMNSDKEKITQIIYNLLSNALKACDTGDKVSILMKEQSSKVIISVVDTGIGIEEDSLDKIFERNFRVDNERNKNVQGSGLGLSITKDLVESLSGEIFVESKKGSGSKFTIHLPNKL